MYDRDLHDRQGKPAWGLALAVALACSGAPATAEWEEASPPDPMQVEQQQLAQELRLVLEEQGVSFPMDMIYAMIDQDPGAVEQMLSTRTPRLEVVVINTSGPARLEVDGEKTISSDTLSSATASVRATDTYGSDGMIGYRYNGLVGTTEAAVRGQRTDNSASGYLGYHSASGLALSSSSMGVYGSASDATSGVTSYGVYGSTSRPDGYGVYARNTSASDQAGVALYAKSDTNGSSSLGLVNVHTAVIENSQAANAKGLAVYLSGNTDTGFSTADNFITFIVDDDTDTPVGVGAIDGNNDGTVRFYTAAADIAEWLERQDHGEAIEPGDIVGVKDGKISKSLAGAHQYKVISSGPAVSGGAPGEMLEQHFEQVAFLGQTPTKVVGKVDAGDYIVPSGRNDGVGIALAPEEMTGADFRQVVGQAWESSDDSEVKLIRAAVGMAANDAYGLVERQNQRIQKLEGRLAAQDAELAAMTARMEGLSRQMAALQGATQHAER